MKQKKYEIQKFLKIDQYGRVVIDDEDLLSLVSGAYKTDVNIIGDDNTACHDNGGCADAGCGD